MKNCNRRDFLKLTGLTALALTFSACGSAPAKDPKALLDSINEYRASNGLSALIYNDALEDWAKLDMQCFKAENSADATMTLDDWYAGNFETYFSIGDKLATDGFDTNKIRRFGVVDTVAGCSLTKLYPTTEAALKAQMAELTMKADTYSYIGIAMAEFDGETYWLAAMLPSV